MNNLTWLLKTQLTTIIIIKNVINILKYFLLNYLIFMNKIYPITRNVICIYYSVIIYLLGLFFSGLGLLYFLTCIAIINRKNSLLFSNTAHISFYRLYTYTLYILFFFDKVNIIIMFIYRAYYVWSGFIPGVFMNVHVLRGTILSICCYKKNTWK